MALRETGRKLKEKVERYIKEKIKVKAEVIYATKIGSRDWILAKIANHEQKTNIMLNKKLLGAERVFIDNDKMTKESKILE